MIAEKLACVVSTLFIFRDKKKTAFCGLSLWQIITCTTNVVGNGFDLVLIRVAVRQERILDRIWIRIQCRQPLAHGV